MERYNSKHTEWSDIMIIAGDYGTKIIDTILDEDGNVVPLGNVTSVILKIRKLGDTISKQGTCTVLDANAAKVQYKTVQGDFPTSGVYIIQHTITFNDNSSFSSEPKNVTIGESI
jgi:hypothetical protein